SSDGLHGVVGTEEIERVLLTAASSLPEKCADLIEAANAAGSPDNITVVLIRIAG
ncbi:MAG: family protein phosphatase, partial [Bryobacterales bacterium]|nr:family protein phosphatase [Bryobacterales bacterium]